MLDSVTLNANKKSAIDKGNTIQAALITVFCLLNLGLSIQFDSWASTWPATFFVVSSAVIWSRLTNSNKFSYVVMPCLSMIAVGVHINTLRGFPEAHFAVFVTIAAAMVYRHYLPVLVAAAAIAVHHIAINELQIAGFPVYCFPDPDRLRVVIHATYVVVETAILLVITHSSATAFKAGDETVSLFDHVNGEDGRFDLNVSAIPIVTEVAKNGKNCLESLHTAIESIDRELHGVSSFSQQIAAGNHALSERTEKQSEDLQNTESSVNLISQRASQNSEMAERANENIHQLLTLISDGDLQLTALEKAVAEVSRFSEEIEQTVSVINGFAFQTNILALNAAVEAARAGEQGKGFAVVASEVRSLAESVNRSASEIGELIEKSAAAVAAGESLALSSSKNMKRMVSSTELLSRLSDEIQASAQGQIRDSESIQQLVKEISTQTSQNSGLTEQTRTLTNTMERALQQVKTQIDQFKLSV